MTLFDDNQAACRKDVFVPPQGVDRVAPHFADLGCGFGGLLIRCVKM